MNDLPEFPPPPSAMFSAPSMITPELTQIILHSFFYGILCTFFVVLTLSVLTGLLQRLRDLRQLQLVRRDPDFKDHVQWLIEMADMSKPEAESLALHSYPNRVVHRN